MKKTSERTQRWRIFLLGPIAALAVASIIATGGGDDEVADVPAIPPTILPSYDFQIRALQGGSAMEFDAGGIFNVEVDFGRTLLGSVNLGVSPANEVTFLSYVTNAGSDLVVTVTDNVSTLDGTFTIDVTAAINAMVDENPTSGAFDVVTALDTVTVSINGTGVELSLNGGTPVPFTWDEFTDLLNDPMAEDWQRLASLAGGTLEFIYELVFGVADQFDDLELAFNAGTTTETCDMFTGSPPASVMAQGENTLTWIGAGSELLSGDDFLWSFTDCWFDDPTDDTDELINGAISLEDYVEVIDGNNLLIAIGFEAVEFTNWKVSETDENQGVFTIDPANDVTINRGFFLQFNAP